MDDSIKKELKHISTCLLKLTEAVKEMNRANTEKFEAVMLLLEPPYQSGDYEYKWKDWPEEKEKGDKAKNFYIPYYEKENKGLTQQGIPKGQYGIPKGGMTATQLAHQQIMMNQILKTKVDLLGMGFDPKIIEAIVKKPEDL